jgi:hypothetical protein
MRVAFNTTYCMSFEVNSYTLETEAAGPSERWVTTYGPITQKTTI